MRFFYQQHGQTVGPLAAEAFLSDLKRNAVDLDAKVRTDASMVWMTLPHLLESGLLEKAAQAAAAGQPASSRQAHAERLRSLAYSGNKLVGKSRSIVSVKEQVLAYGHFLEHEFPLNRPPGPCTVYPHKAAEERAIFTWQAEFQGATSGDLRKLAPFLHLLLGPFGLLIGLIGSRADPKQILTFRTAHDFSHIAASNRRWAWRAARVLQVCFNIEIILLVIFGLALLPISMAAFADDYPGTEHDRSAHIFSVAINSFFALGLFVFTTYVLIKILRLPPALRTLEKRPLFLKKITWQPLRQNYTRLRR